MIRMHRRISGAVTVLTMAALILTGCTSEASSISSAKNKTEGVDVVDTGFTMSTVGSYDSADTAVVLSTDEANKAVTFINMDTGKQYTLYYDGTTYVKDKYDGPMTISQIEPGDVVDVTFLKGKKRLASIKLSPDAWVYDDVYNYDLAGANRTASIGSQSYSLPESVVVLSGGRRVDKAEVVSQDVVTISGIEHKIYSINVDKGHGYLSLKNEQPLLGGWIEVGNSMIRQIKEDMLLVVPEGTYQVVLNNNGIGCVKDVTIERDKEVVLDVDDIEIPEDATGKILFSVSPENATVAVDGKPVDTSKVVELSYGIHRVEASASGYDTLTKHIQVGSEYATISFKLEETRKEDNSVSGNSITRDPWKESETEPVEETTVDDSEIAAPESVSENALRSSKNGTAEVHVKDWTTGAELQGVTVRLEIEDSNKKITSTRSKTSPCSFSKEKDAHKYRFTLSMDGYETKSFEPDLEEYQKDETLYFMIKKQGTETSSPTSSNEGIKSNVVAAIASAASTCILTNGPDAYIYIPYEEGKGGNLTASGKEKIEKAITEAVIGEVGNEGIKDYKKFEVDQILQNVKPVPETGDYQATASVTVMRNGYKDEKITVSVVIKNYIVTISPELDNGEKFKRGEKIQFTAEVKDGKGSIMETPTIIWEINGSESEAGADKTAIDTNGRLIIGSEESASEIIVTATYMDGNISKGVGEVKVPISKITVKITPPTDPVEIGDKVELKVVVTQDDEDITSSSHIEWEIEPAGEEWSLIEDNQWIPQKAGTFTIKAIYTDEVRDEGEDSRTVEYLDSVPVKVDDAKEEEEDVNEEQETSEDNSSTMPTKPSENLPTVETENSDSLPSAETEDPDKTVPEISSDSTTIKSETMKDSTQMDSDNSDHDSEVEPAENKDVNSGNVTDTNNLTEETISVTQESHPIRNFFSSLFK